MRVQVQSKQTVEANVPLQAEVGPSLEFYLPPWIKLAEMTRFDLDDAKPRPLVLSIGYRYLPETSVGGPATNRMEPVATVHFPITNAICMTDRNRFDLDWKNGGFFWRYRNRVQVEGPVGIDGYHFKPYVSVEAFYQSKYDKWSDTAIYAGSTFPIGRKVQIDSYYEHQNQTGTVPNQRLNQVGLILNLYF
jgi:hypothetical protein